MKLKVDCYSAGRCAEEAWQSMKLNSVAGVLIRHAGLDPASSDFVVSRKINVTGYRLSPV